MAVMFVDLDEFTQQNLRNALSPDQVAEVIHAAATARRPRLRYYTPFSVRGLPRSDRRWSSSLARLT